MNADTPSSFYDMSWIAVRGAGADSMIEMLALSDPVPVRWVQGLHALWSDIWDFAQPLESHWSRVYITPLLDGWRLGLGPWLGGGSHQDVMDIAEHCRVLSSKHGRACVFTTQGRMDFYAWTLAANGRLQRVYVWDGEVVIDRGKAPLRERALLEAEENQAPDELVVMELAASFSLDIASLGPATKVKGRGFLCRTPVGRESKGGAPSRPLCSCDSISDPCDWLSSPRPREEGD